MSDELLLSRARSAWNAAKRDDDENMREASELRLARAWPRPRIPATRAFAFGAAAAFAVAALLFVAFGRPRSPFTAAVTSPAATVAPAAPRTSAPLPSAAPDVADAPPADRRPARVVATAACKECRLEAGAVVSERVVVPAGARLSLGFAFDDGLVDPASGVDLVGPAAATSTADAVVTIERGVVRVRAPRNVVVLVPGGKVSASNAVYTLRIDERGVARIDVEKGRVAVTKGDASEVVVPAGSATYELAARSEPVASPSAPSPSASASIGATTADDVLASAKQGLARHGNAVAEEMLDDARVRARQGDASGRSELEQLAASKDARVARRASFTLAELDLASGAKEKARARLDELVTCPESALGADAATLLARSYGTPTERAEVWRRYLATSPPSPYSERALLERADALLDAGRTAEAKRILEELRRTAKLTESQQRQLDRLTVKAR